jgi:hypothetical protein
MSTIIPKIKYLTNKDLLAAIHESKLTFCSFVDTKYKNYDVIVHSLDGVTLDTLEAARQKKLSDLQADEKKESRNKNFVSMMELDQVPLNEVVVRVMMFDHVPLNPAKEGKAKTVAEKHIRCQFPPFQHFIWDEDTWKCVGKSHWKGGMQNGEFSLHHGKVTNRLGAMWMKLVERYGHRGNWRGYTYLDEMRAQALLQLSQVGLQFDESKSSNPFAYYTQCVSTSFLKILTTEKKSQSIRDDLLIMNNSTPSHTRQVEDQMAQRMIMAGPPIASPTAVVTPTGATV